jgi:tetratricopeptide (TPR) repeat protein
MLFDLRARGRRRTVKAVYLSLAILMGGGLVLFGIGGDVQGGLFDAFDSQNQTGAADDVVQQRLEDAERRVRADRQDPAAWAALADVRFQIANNGEGYNPTVGAYTDEGKAQLQQARRAWEQHLALTDKPDTDLANKMALALGQAGLQDYDAAVAALEVVIDADEEPSAARYAQLAILAEQAGQSRKSTLAEQRAIELTPKDQRDQVKAQIALGKQQASQQAPEPVAPPTTTAP